MEVVFKESRCADTQGYKTYSFIAWWCQQFVFYITTANKILEAGVAKIEEDFPTDSNATRLAVKLADKFFAKYPEAK